MKESDATLFCLVREGPQDFAGPAGHVVEFRSLQLSTVVELTVVEWQEQQKGKS